MKCLIGNTRFSGLASVNGPALDSTIVFIMANWDWNAFQVRGIYDGGSRISGPAYFTVRSTGDVGIGTESPQAKLDVRGTTRTSVLVIAGGSDLAEPFSESTDSDIDAKPGMVMSIDPANPGALRIATAAYDTRVAGVYSGGNGLPTGMVMGKEGCELTAPGEDKIPLAMTGRVWVYADESNGVIKPGDRLTTSGSKPGHAMRATDRERWDGAVIGKAMTSVDPESGMVMVLVNLQ